MTDVAANIRQSLPPVPFAGAYWVVPGSLLAGMHPGDHDHAVMHARMAGLLATGIRHVVSLIEEGEADREGRPLESYRTEWKICAVERNIFASAVSFPITEHRVPAITTMRAILDHIDRTIEQGLPVFIHDHEGRGRTGTVAGCYLARHGIAAGVDVPSRLRELRRDMPDAALPSPESEEQVRFVTAWRAGE